MRISLDRGFWRLAIYVQTFRFFIYRVLIVLVNSCDHTLPIQNTKPPQTPRFTPKYTPNPPPKPKYRKNTKNMRKSPNFVYFSYIFRIFSVFSFWRGIWGVFWGSEGFCILYGERMIASEEFQQNSERFGLRNRLAKFEVPICMMLSCDPAGQLRGCLRPFSAGIPRGTLAQTPPFSRRHCQGHSPGHGHSGPKGLRDPCSWLVGWQIFQERKISPKRKFSGRISRGHPGVIRADIPAQNFGQGAQNPGITSIWARISMTRSRGRPRP